MAALGDWTLAAVPIAGVCVAVGLYLRGVRLVRERQSAQWPKGRTASFLTGCALLLVAAVTPIGTYEDLLFSVHMVQHLLMVSIAAPLLMASAPVTLAIRASTSSFRRRVLLPVLRSWPVKAVTFPPFAWAQFAVVMWGSHFTYVFDAALTDPWLHELEHVVYLVSACLFWWPAFGVDPSRWKLSYGARAFYVFLGMPQMTLLALALWEANSALYPRYAAVAQVWGVDAFADQKLAAFIMWGPSELIYVVALMVIIKRWLDAEERRSVIEDRRLDAERAAAQAMTAASTAIDTNSNPR